MRSRYRNPRIPFSTTEVGALERKFLQSPYLGSNDVNELAAALNMSPKRVGLRLIFSNYRLFYSISTVIALVVFLHRNLRFDRLIYVDNI